MTIDAPVKEQIPMLRQLWQDTFGDSDTFLDCFFSLAFSPERCRCVAEDGQVQAALYWFDCSCRGEKMAYLYAVATAEVHRGKGLCRALMEDTHRHLRHLGYRAAILVPAGVALRQMYAGMGYLPGTAVSELTCRAGTEAVALQKLDASEYERRRRTLLGEDAVLQEGAFTTLLENLCDLYGGDGFLLAAQTEDGILQAEELLGDVAAAPGILRRLGVEEGCFRIPGVDKPFAMYRPLVEDCPQPGYFGISFG